MRLYTRTHSRVNVGLMAPRSQGLHCRNHVQRWSISAPKSYRAWWLKKDFKPSISWSWRKSLDFIMFQAGTSNPCYSSTTYWRGWMFSCRSPTSQPRHQRLTSDLTSPPWVSSQSLASFCHLLSVVYSNVDSLIIWALGYRFCHSWNAFNTITCSFRYR